MSPVAVFDCMIFLQALASPRGPAFRCFSKIEAGEASLAVSTATIAEVRNVLGRYEIQQKFPLVVPSRVEKFLKAVIARSKLIHEVPDVFQLPRDPKDSPYVNLAIAADADYLVTWNMRHMGYLLKKDTPEGRDFCLQFPKIKIVEPPSFLHEMDQIRQSGSPH